MSSDPDTPSTPPASGAADSPPEGASETTTPPASGAAEPPPEGASETTAATTSTTTAEPVEAKPEHGRTGTGTGPLRVLSVLVLVGGVILMAAGAFTWVVVQKTLSDEEITVSEDANHFGGDKVRGPFTAYAQAEVINDHALEETGGLTYAQLERDDPRRDTVMTASFLRASLFTSVVSFGVAAFAFGLGILLILVGWALLRVDRSLRAVPAST